jgi:hypothetical protein
MNAAISLIEPLESRIAPAAIFVNATTGKYTDVDGDHVTAKFSKPILTSNNVTAVLQTTAVGVGDQLVAVDLAFLGAPAAGTSITFSVARVPGGDGLANVGLIDASGINLGNVTVKGDLGQIDAGSGSGTAIASLSANSMGRLGTDTQFIFPSLVSTIDGALGSLKIATDDIGTDINVSGKIGSITIGGSLIGGSGTDAGSISASGTIGSVKIGHDVQGGAGIDSGYIASGSQTNIGTITIGGSLIGGAGNNSGCIATPGSPTDDQGQNGAVTIGGSVIGGTANSSGAIISSANIAAITIGGSLIGGSVGGSEDAGSGMILGHSGIGAVKIGHDVSGSILDPTGSDAPQSGIASVTIGGSVIGGSIANNGWIASTKNIGPVKIGHDVEGGTASGTGAIFSGEVLAQVTIEGSLIGGTGNSSGVISGADNLGPVKIGGDLVGGSIGGTTGALDSSGLIESVYGNITSVKIGGSIISGSDASTGGALTNNASIRALGDIGALTVDGSVIGNPDGATGDAASPVVISAGGLTTAPYTAIGKITIGDRVEDAVILAGYDTNLNPVNADAQIGAVKVGSDWIASDLVAGATNSDLPSGAPFPNFGNASDASIGGGAAGVLSKIASITIGGQVYGTPDSVNATDNFGFVAQAISSVKIGGYAITVPMNGTPLNVGETTDVDIHII